MNDPRPWLLETATRLLTEYPVERCKGSGRNYSVTVPQSPRLQLVRALSRRSDLVVLTDGVFAVHAVLSNAALSYLLQKAAPVG